MHQQNDIAQLSNTIKILMDTISVLVNKVDMLQEAIQSNSISNIQTPLINDVANMADNEEKIKDVQVNIISRLKGVQDVMFTELQEKANLKPNRQRKKEQEKALIESLRNNAHKKIAYGL